MSDTLLLDHSGPSPSYLPAPVNLARRLSSEDFLKTSEASDTQYMRMRRASAPLVPLDPEVNY